MSSKVLLVLACVLFFGVSGCADLPDVAALAASVTDRAKTPDLIDADGSVPNQRVRQILLANAAASSGMLQDHLPVAAAISTAPLVAGNRTTLLHEGRAIEQAVLSAIASATSSINIESYIIADDAAGRRFADLLIRKRAEHVAINIIYDGLASRGTSEAFFDRLRAAGIRLLEFNPINPFVARAAWAPNIRDHRKVFIVDGSIAIIGGANVELPSEAHDGNWRDTDVRIEGPAVAQLQKLFMQTWTAQGGGPLEHADYFPKTRRAGNEIIRVLGNDGGRDGKSPIYSSLVSAIDAAKQSVNITTPYFAPDPQLLAALEAAAMRGVHVRLMLPGRSNVPVVFAAGRAHYQELLDAGVEIYERDHAWLHAKTAVIDGIWSTVGTATLDRRSFLFNYEVNAFVIGSDFARQLEIVFERDVAQSRPILSGQWRERVLAQRVAQWSADLFSYWW